VTEVSELRDLTLIIAPVATDLDWRVSVGFLDLLDEEQRRRLLEGARAINRRAGVVLEYPSGALTGDVIESGLVRAYQISEDGRQSTIGYLYAGEYLGALPALAPRPIVFAQHMTDARLLRLDADNLQLLFASDVAFARALAIHTASILSRVVRVVTVRTLGTIRERLAFDLLERASVEQLRSGQFEFHVAQEELAEAIGSAREVVNGHLAELRKAGIVSTSRRRIRINDPARLAGIFRPLVT
jgi:CRP/FNR family cyclic AMP-dependent transcriptional regulator